MDNQYTDPQLFALMKSNYNLISVVTCRDNRKEFDSKQLLLDTKCDKWTFKGLVDKHIGVVIKI